MESKKAQNENEGETMTHEIRIAKGKKSCDKCSAHGLYWHQSRAGNWVLFELIDIVDEAGDSVDSTHRAHYAYCGADVEQAPAKVTPEIDAETRNAIHEAIGVIYDNCDGATRRDGAGFSKHDARFGHDLARAGSLSNNMAAAGRRMVKKYRRQLTAAGFDLDRLN
jgi:hypothetical protein